MATMARFDWLSERAAGILLHPSSLPSPNGIGNLGQAARDFVDFLAEAGLRYWQVLPLGPTGFGNSPYSAYSVFAGNPLLLDLEVLTDAGLLRPDELEALRHLPANEVDYETLQRVHRPLLGLANRRFRDRGQAYLGDYGLLDEFLEEQAEWLEPYALFMALKERHGGQSWTAWPPEARHYEQARQVDPDARLAEAIETHRFVQYLFWGQWQALRRYAALRKVSIIGDLPIYAAGDSADTWSERAVFRLDREGRAQAVAGVPPDYFSEIGQLWGNPLYDWDYLKETGYGWWMRRLRHNFALCDAVRLDHFRAFWDYWEIPADAVDARSGQWREGPQHAFFETLRRELGAVRLIAEDLGEISSGVRTFLHELGLPGMAVLQFAFDGQDPNNLFLPHNLVPNSVVYTGTHDNDTTLGWYEKASPEAQDQLRRYLRVSGEDIVWDLLRAAFRSVSRIAIVPMQDLLVLGSGQRMNTPGVAGGNWRWRMTQEEFARQRASAGYFRELTWLYGR